ncbi:Actin-fragmin kinase [Thelohanellus kitauei]|uniref:Actin-fragmin kinase n=1 Tax=Thelohanellus kitauei TaxID=669202 RepID=A0A0C2MQH5_THEKT|nr:Actin-fragmin kinase [Thelohanellus kitauei]
MERCLVEDDDDDDDDDDDNDKRQPPMYVRLVVYHDESLYIIGIDAEDEALNCIYKFCLETLTWSRLPDNNDTPPHCFNQHCTVFNSQLYVFEDTLTGRNRYHEVSIFDFSTNSWSIRSTSSKEGQYPNDRVNEAYAFSNNCAYMSGGKSEDGSICFSDIWRIDLENLEWLKLNDFLKTAGDGHKMCVVEDVYLYSFRGDGSDEGCFKRLERFTLRFPSLYRLSLECLFRSPNVRNYIKLLPTRIMVDLNLSDKNSYLDD